MRYFWIILIVFVLASCTKNKRQEGTTFSDSVTLNITVKDKAGTLMPNVRVQLYKTEADYNAALDVRNAGAGYVSGLTSTAGFVSFNTVEANIEQYIYATYFDSTNSIFYSNENISSKIEKIPAGSEVDMQITIEPLTSNVVFYTLSNTVNTNPIFIKLGPTRRDTLVAPTAGIPTAQTPEAALFSVDAGVYSYQAHDDAGCSWTGEVDVNPGELELVNLEPCQIAKIMIYFVDSAPVSAVTHGTYEVYVDGAYKGTLEDIYPNNGSPSTCGLNDNVFAVTVFVDAGSSHSLQVKNATSPCTFIQSITAGAVGSCTPVPLQKAIINSNICP